MRTLIFSLSIIVVLLIIPFPMKAQQSETERLNEWFDTRYEELLQMSPMSLTTLGRKDQYDKIDDMSIAAADKQLEWRAETIADLEEEFDYDSLEPDAKVSWDLWKFQYELAKDAKDFRHIDYIFDQMRGPHTRLPQFLINFHIVDSVEDMDDYISRIKGISRAMNQLTERAYSQSEAGIHPPKFAYETVKRESQSLLSGAPFTDDNSQSPLWEDALAKIEALQEAEKIDAETAESYKESTREALLEHFKPAYEELIFWIDGNIDQAEVNPVGISRHPDGEDFYRYLLQLSTTTDLTADEIHNTGLKEVERILDEMRNIKQQVGFDGTLDEFFSFIRTDDQFYYPDTDEGRQAYIEDSKQFLEGIEEQLSEFFGILPKASLVVRRVEAFREQDGAPQHYMPGTPDGSRPGVYYAHLSDMKSMPNYEMEAIAYHEGNPGHHMQISIAQELDSVPQFRTQERYAVYTEGWALYTEKLAKEMGGYTDPYSDFGRLSAEIWRAIRLVVDTGMHAKGWTKEEAVEYFMNNGPVPEGAVRAEIRRYLVIPGQATSYKIGMIKIEELRAKAEEVLGEMFDIRGFHDTILGGGSMPLHILEQLVNRWIEEQKAG
ncbi:DUF885 domain-containing protein [soil metagenome]